MYFGYDFDFCLEDEMLSFTVTSDHILTLLIFPTEYEVHQYVFLAYLVFRFWVNKYSQRNMCLVLYCCYAFDFCLEDEMLSFTVSSDNILTLQIFPTEYVVQQYVFCTI